tara:strand:+ start:3673 stop:4134 length:462 start_codon:yes stop_codon:yes gene_type:complete
MKASDLVKIIRKVVKEEISLAIRKELRPIIKEVKTKAVKRVAKKPVSKVQSKSFTSDNTLNSILNETAQQIASENGSDWPTMGNGQMTSQDARNGLASLMGMNDPNQMFGGQPSAQQMIPDDRKGAPVPEALEKALTRDYSELVKAMDIKKGK